MLFRSLRVCSICAVALLICALMSLQIADATQSTGDAQGSDLFDRLNQSQDCRFVGDFTQTRQLAGLDKPIEAIGHFLFDCDLGVIWATTEPEADVLVLRNTTEQSKARAYRYANAQVQRLKNRQSKFLSELIMSLIAADRGALSTQFDLQNLGTHAVLMLPKKRGLKRALKQVEVRMVDHGDGEPSMQISMLDRNNQLTRMDSVKRSTFSQLGNQQCRDQSFHPTVCDLLFEPEASAETE